MFRLPFRITEDWQNGGGFTRRSLGPGARDIRQWVRPAPVSPLLFLFLLLFLNLSLRHFGVICKQSEIAWSRCLRWFGLQKL